MQGHWGLNYPKNEYIQAAIDAYADLGLKVMITELDIGRNDTPQRELAEIIKYDMEIRKLVVSRGGLDAEILEFLFGRPLTKTLPNYGIKVQQQDEKIILVPKGKRKL